jgi:inward rectifier potassium channel
LFVFIFITINSAFGLAYFLIADGIENVHPGSFRDVFFFSVQTLSTIGYGKMVPLSLAANMVVTCEVMVGIIFTAVTTGLVFSKFSRPMARVVFSNVAVITVHDGMPHLMLRLANERDSRIVDARIQVALLRKETSPEGHLMRRFHDLALLRHQIPFLQLSWTVMHPIDSDSPLHEATTDTLRDWDLEIVVSLTGLDETFSQTVHSRHSYIVDDIVFDADFVDVMRRREPDNGIDVDLSRIHDVRPSNIHKK